MAKSMVTCVVTCYKKDPTPIIEEMLNQSYKKKQILVFCSDIDIMPLRKKYPKIEFFDVPNRKDWGHTKRAMGLTFAEGKYVCFANDDDRYDPKFLEIMVGILDQSGAELAYCDWQEKTLKGKRAFAQLIKGGITSGNFVVDTKRANKVGWQTRLYASDWYFMRDLLKDKVQIVYVPHSLMTHN